MSGQCCGSAHLWKMVLMTVGVVFLSLFLIFLTRNAWKQYDYIGRSAEVRDTISMTGEGKVVVVPDIAKVSLGLETKNFDVAKAQKENSDRMNQVIGDLKALDVAKEDIKTTNYNIYPNYDWTSGSQTLLNYSVTQTVEIKIRDLNKVSQVLALAGKYNLNQVGGLQFSVDNIEAVREEARIKAFDQAKSKAKVLAEAAGVKLGNVVSFYENNGGSYYYSDDVYGLGGSPEASYKEPTIETGSQDVIVNVTIDYEIL